MRAVVFGYHEIGYVCLDELLAAGVEVPALFTHRDDPGEEIWFHRPREIAEKQGIPVYEPESLRDPSWVELLRDMSPDYLFSFYYRNMLPREVLEVPRVLPLNLHGSLLPRFRGRAPVNWVLVEGEIKTGLTLHVMEVKPDAGDIIAQIEVEISFEDTAYALFKKMASAAGELMRETVPRLIGGTFIRKPQVGPSSYYGGRRPEDGIIDWGRDATSIYNLIRAVTHPYPGAFTFLGSRKLFIWWGLPEPDDAYGSAGPGTIVTTDPLRVKAGQGLLRLVSLQLEGEGEQTSDAFVATHSLENQTLGGTV